MNNDTLNVVPVSSFPPVIGDIHRVSRALALIASDVFHQARLVFNDQYAHFNLQVPVKGTISLSTLTRPSLGWKHPFIFRVSSSRRGTMSEPPPSRFGGKCLGRLSPSTTIG